MNDEMKELVECGEFGATELEVIAAAVSRLHQYHAEQMARRQPIADAILSLRDEVALEWGGAVSIGETVVRIDTRASRDPRRSRNGGEYYEWVEVRRNEYGQVLIEDCTSCELANRHEPELVGDNWQAIVSEILALAERYKVPVVSTQ